MWGASGPLDSLAVFSFFDQALEFGAEIELL